MGYEAFTRFAFRSCTNALEQRHTAYPRQIFDVRPTQAALMKHKSDYQTLGPGAG